MALRNILYKKSLWPICVYCIIGSLLLLGVLVPVPVYAANKVRDNLNIETVIDEKADADGTAPDMEEDCIVRVRVCFFLCFSLYLPHSHSHSH